MWMRFPLFTSLVLGLTITAGGLSAQQDFSQVEIEVTTVKEAQEALDGGADVILLDNMPVDEMRDVVTAARGRALIEASGGVALGNVRAIAEAGVDVISVGAITHSAPALDISLELDG